MNQDRDKRKLSAILSADVVGYSRLMEEEASWTIKNLEENKTLISDLVKEYKGRVVDAPGDNLLAEFGSITNAVECAVKIQQELKKKNANIVENRRMEFRIGINLGEVFEEEGRIYGSGVNIAARIEGLSDSGGICISGRTYDHVKKQLDLGYEYLGEHNVKNISEPIQVYRVVADLGSTEKIIREKRVTGIFSTKAFISTIISVIIIVAGLFIWKFYPSQPEEQAPKTIAVLPFEDISPEKDQEYFVDGLSEEILNTLCQIPDLLVTARTSSFSFKGSDKTVQEIASMLGVENILEGSVRKAEDALRITAQLVRASDGFHLWSKTYDRELKDIFSVQENIANAVANELKLKLGISKSLNQLGGTDNLEAYEIYLVAKEQSYRFELVPALESINSAIVLDSGFALAWALKSLIHSYFAALRSTSPDDISLELDKALEAAGRATELEPDLSKAYLSLGYAHTYRGEFINAEKAFRKGIELTIEQRDYWRYGLTLHYTTVGHLRKCYELLGEARQNDPLDPAIRGWYVSFQYYFSSIEEIEEELERCKAIFGSQWVSEVRKSLLRFNAKDILSINEIHEMLDSDDPISKIVKENIESPKDVTVELRRLFDNSDNLNLPDFRNLVGWATYFDDPEFAMDVIEKANLKIKGGITYWTPLLYEVRQLPRFKEFVREIGLVEYWKEYGWPDICRPVGDGDFVCD